MSLLQFFTCQNCDISISQFHSPELRKQKFYNDGNNYRCRTCQALVNRHCPVCDRFFPMSLKVETYREHRRDCENEAAENAENEENERKEEEKKKDENKKERENHSSDEDDDFEEYDVDEDIPLAIISIRKLDLNKNGTDVKQEEEKKLVDPQKPVEYKFPSKSRDPNAISPEKPKQRNDEKEQKEVLCTRYIYIGSHSRIHNKIYGLKDYKKHIMKIGRTENLQKRLSQYNTHNPHFEYIVKYKFENVTAQFICDVETDITDCLGEAVHGSEWFFDTQEARNAVEKICIHLNKGEKEI